MLMSALIQLLPEKPITSPALMSFGLTIWLTSRHDGALTGSVAAGVGGASSWPHFGMDGNMLHLPTSHRLNIVDVPGRAVTTNRVAMLVGGPTVFAAVLTGIGDNATARTPDRELH